VEIAKCKIAQLRFPSPQGMYIREQLQNNRRLSIRLDCEGNGMAEGIETAYKLVLRCRHGEYGEEIYPEVDVAICDR